MYLLISKLYPNNQIDLHKIRLPLCYKLVREPLGARLKSRLFGCRQSGPLLHKQTFLILSPQSSNPVSMAPSKTYFYLILLLLFTGAANLPFSFESLPSL